MGEKVTNADSGARTGYSGKSLAAKLGLQAGQRMRLHAAPPGYWRLAEFDPTTLVLKARAGPVDVVHAFVTGRSELERLLPRWLTDLQTGAMLWLSWPKKSSGVATDLTEDVLREVVLPTGWVDVKVCAVDATWSALKFLRRKPR